MFYNICIYVYMYLYMCILARISPFRHFNGWFQASISPDPQILGMNRIKKNHLFGTVTWGEIPNNFSHLTKMVHLKNGFTL